MGGFLAQLLTVWLLWFPSYPFMIFIQFIPKRSCTNLGAIICSFLVDFNSCNLQKTVTVKHMYSKVILEYWCDCASVCTRYRCDRIYNSTTACGFLISYVVSILHPQNTVYFLRISTTLSYIFFIFLTSLLFAPALRLSQCQQGHTGIKDLRLNAEKYYLVPCD